MNATAPTTTVNPLTLLDTCDRCGSRAFLRATMPSGLTVHLCAHHGTKHEPVLRLQGAVIHDERGLLEG